MSYPVPAGLDPKLEYYLKQLEARVLLLERDPGVTVEEDDGDETPPLFIPSLQRITPSTAAATGTGAAAWTTYDISADMPDQATYALMWCHVEVGSSGDQGSIDFRQESGAVTVPALKTASCQSNTDTASDSGEFMVPISASKTIDYQVTGTLSGTDSAWEIKVVGYL